MTATKVRRGAYVFSATFRPTKGKRWVRVPGKKPAKWRILVTNPATKASRKTVGTARRRPWTLLDALQWSERIAREETPAQRAESRRVWAALVRAGLA